MLESCCIMTGYEKNVLCAASLRPAPNFFDEDVNFRAGALGTCWAMRGHEENGLGKANLHIKPNSSMEMYCVELVHLKVLFQ